MPNVMPRTGAVSSPSPDPARSASCDTATAPPTGRPVTILDGQLAYLDESHLSEAERSRVSTADALSIVPIPVQYPPEAVAPPTWRRWEVTGENGWRHTSTSPLFEFLDWFRFARLIIRSRGVDYAQGYAHGWRNHGRSSR